MVDEAITTKKMRNSLHDRIIARGAKAAFQQGYDEDACPYQYDLKARKIWLEAYRKEKKRVNKARASNGTVTVAAKKQRG